jgi:hypothetical protein
VIEKPLDKMSKTAREEVFVKITASVEQAFQS